MAGKGMTGTEKGMAGASVVQDLFGLYTTYESGKMRREAMRHNAAMSRFNEQLTEIQVDFDLKRLAETEKAHIGSARQQASGSGFATDAGSNEDIVSSIRRNVAVDAAAIRTKGSLAKFGHQYQQGQFGLMGKQAKTATNMNMASTIMSSASKYAQMFAKTGA